jgi:hypothetical protein
MQGGDPAVSVVEECAAFRWLRCERSEPRNPGSEGRAATGAHRWLMNARVLPVVEEGAAALRWLMNARVLPVVEEGAQRPSRNPGTIGRAATRAE